MAAELGQQTAEFSALVQRATEDSFLALRELVERAKAPEEQSDAQKKIELLKYIFKTRQRMLRLHVLAKWCQQVPLVQRCQQLAATLSSHDTCFTQAADSLFFTHEGLQQARAPIYDVPSAMEVLLTGSYRRLPKCIEDLGLQTTLTDDQQIPVLKNLDTLIRSKLLAVQLPKEISEVKVCDGTVLIRVNGEFKVLLTLGYRGHLSMWRILHIELLVGERNGTVKLEESRRYALGDDLERRMAAAEKPFGILYSILHELCIALVMDTVIRQVQLLRQGRWKDAIRFELISDGSSGQSSNVGPVLSAQDGESDSAGQKTPGLKIVYWLDFEKTAAGTDSGSSPFIKIEPGQDLQIRCLHNAFVLDPLTDKEAEFSLDQSCIDVEGLLLRAIACNRHTRLLEIQREIGKNAQICQAADDVVLKSLEDGIVQDLSKENWGDEVLCVRAYGSLYLTLGVNIRNGHFLLQSSKNIIVPSALSECEDALNQGSMTAAEVFISLRSKSILHLFASIGRFLGLKVCERDLTALKIPKSMLNGSDSLLMGFAQCGSSYYLLMQLDRDFRPLFGLLETQPDSGGGSHSGECKHVIRCNKIDIGQIEVLEDELNLSLLNWQKMQSSMPITGGSNHTSEHSHLSDFGSESSLQLTGYPQSSFSAAVDEVFEFEKAASEHPYPVQNHLSLSFSMPSQLSSLQGMKAGIGSPKWEGGLQYSQISNMAKVSSGGSTVNSSVYLSSSVKGLLQNAPVNSLSSSSPLRISSSLRLPSSQSDQDLSSIKSPSQSGANGVCSAIDDDHERLQNGSSKEGCLGIVKSRSGRMISPIRTSGSRLSMGTTKVNGPKSSSNGHAGGSFRLDGSILFTGTSRCQLSISGVSKPSSDDGVPKHDKNLQKRSLSDIVSLIPSLHVYDSTRRLQKRRKIVDSALCHSSASRAFSSTLASKTDGYTYGSILSEANHGLAPPNVYVSALLHVVRHCSLCIKHAQLTSQMDALEIPYVEEVGLRTPSSNLWFRLPFARDDSWQHICLHLGKPGSMSWDVKVSDPYFKELWVLQKGNTGTGWGCGVRIANASDTDSHIRFDSEGVVLSYKTVEVDSIEKLVSDLRRLLNARLFARGMRKLLGVRSDDKLEDSSDSKIQYASKGGVESGDKMSEQIKRTFKIEAVGLMSLWFCYGTMPVMAHFVVDWEAGKDGCTMHASPDQVWPHTKFLEDFINGGEVASFLDCIRLTTGPLLALSHAIRPARVPSAVASGPSPILKQNGFVHSQGYLPNTSSTNANQPAPSGPVANSTMIPLANHVLHNTAMLSAASGRGGPGIVPSSLLPFDVSVVLRGPYWVRIIYRKKFAVDMRCFAGDQVWLQPATPPKGGPATGGSLPCPQFRPFIMELVAQGLNALEPSFPGGAHASGVMSSSNANPSPGTQPLVSGGNRVITTSSGMPRPSSIAGTQGSGSMSRVGNAILTSSALSSVGPGLPLRISPGTSVPVHVRGELNTAFIGLGDDGGYGGGWVPLAALKKVLRGILKYLGVLWLFAQLPDLLKEILGSILKENEGALLNLDQEQPALRFFVGGYVFAVSVHRVQLLLQVLSVKRFHHQQQQQQQAQTNTQEELASSEINEICDYFCRRVASEPYDASRVASFITLLTLPISVLREFLKLIAWEKGFSQGGEIAPAPRARVELCLENHSGLTADGSESSASKSDIHHDRDHNSVDFALTFVLDPSLIPHINAAGGAAWLPYCVSVRLRYSFGENTHISLIGMEGSHGGRACWLRLEDWDKCKHRVTRAVDFVNGNSVGDYVSQGRLKSIAETLQKTFEVLLRQLRDGNVTSSSVAS
uniref:Mediator of RNA polymerase II transcription subunit 14 n=2 Tax=Anthurium amnicola TaxID=1678845 RepID=A0A1D1Z013_9ARAE